MPRDVAADAAQRRAQVLLDVVGERLQRRDVDEPPAPGGRPRAGRVPRGTRPASCPSRSGPRRARSRRSRSRARPGPGRPSALERAREPVTDLRGERCERIGSQATHERIAWRVRLGSAPMGIGETVADVPGLLRPGGARRSSTSWPRRPRARSSRSAPTAAARPRSWRSARAPAACALLVSVDVDPAAQRAASAALVSHGVGERVLLNPAGSSAAALRRLRGLRPALTFIDGDHSAAGVRRDLEVLERVVPCAAACCSSTTSPTRATPTHRVPEIGVHDAIRASWVERDCEFLGEHGACGLYRSTRGGPPDRRAVPVVDAQGLESPRMQYLQRLRWPACWLLRRFRAR